MSGENDDPRLEGADNEDDDDRSTRNSPDPNLRISQVGDTIVVSVAKTPLPAVLSESEQEIVHAMLAGSRNAEIAELRSTSPKTVANQLYTIYRKLGVGSRDELAAFVSGGGPSAGENDSGDSS